MSYNILLPTDFSGNALSAINYTLKLFSNVSCTFYLQHSWSFSSSTSRTFITSHYIDLLKETSKMKLYDLKDQIETTNSNPNHKFKVIFSYDALLETIKAAVEKHKIDLVAMGTKGASKTKAFFFGSNTVSIVNKMKLCPVLIVPDEFNFIEPKQLAFPTDFNRFYGEELLPLTHIAKLFNSTIRILHITEQDKLTQIQNYNLESLKNYLKNRSSSFHWMPDYAKKTQEINDFIQEMDINILVMINYKHSLIENIIKEPVIQKIGYKPIIPVMIIPCSV